MKGSRRRAPEPCHIFTVVDGIITGLRGYRNERGIPAG